MEYVNHPKHYQENGKECIQVMEERFGSLAVILFCILNAFKYNWRKGKKVGNSESQDSAKGIWYINYAANLFDRLGRVSKLILKIVSPGVYKLLK